MKLKKTISTIFILLAIIIAVVLYFIWPELSSNKSPLPFLKSIKKHKRLIVFEGLPHQMFERELLEKELRAKETIKIKGYPFYKSQLTVNNDDLSTVLEILKSNDTYLGFSGLKMCGGFHPDYAIRFVVEGDEYNALICFGCKEAILTSYSHYSRHDIKEIPFNELRKVLSKYVKSRPGLKF